ncbi:MAG: zinc ribbon domain-containing protein [Deltaproteobacteria bacterium]|nr:zinc ribbon domain-containing protein [Deltaproteobacteria bacterium]
MPIYEFKCLQCGQEFETLVRRSQKTVICPGCGGGKCEKWLSSFRCGGGSGSSDVSQSYSGASSSGSGCGSCSSSSCAGCASH